MVTFICYNCDVTLKKAQLVKHYCGRRLEHFKSIFLISLTQRSAFICIDCKKTFYDNEHAAHTSCLSEQQMSYGQYYVISDCKLKLLRKL